MTDILLNSQFAPQISNGDFVAGDSNAQDVAMLLACNQGEFRQWPTMGVGLSKHMNGSDFAQLKNDFDTQINQIEGKSAQLTVKRDGSVAIEV